MLYYDSMKNTLYKVKQYLNLQKPEAKTWKGWRIWHEKTKAERPLAYFLAETLPDKFDDCVKFFTRPLSELRYGIRVRVFDRYHVINTGLKPGYADGDTRMLHGMFNLLVDFVEVEKAWMQVVFSKEERNKRKHPWWSLGKTRFKAFRDPQAGLDYLTWEMSLDDPNLDATSRCDQQAHAAREIWELYHWWKYTRPARPDPYDASGWSDYCDQLQKSGKDILDFEDDSEDDREQTRQILDKCRQIENEYDQEDQDMLIRLVKIRKNLWT